MYYYGYLYNLYANPSTLFYFVYGIVILSSFENKWPNVKSYNLHNIYDIKYITTTDTNKCKNNKNKLYFDIIAIPNRGMIYPCIK